MSRVPFSQRHGYVPPKLAQVESIDGVLRTRLANAALVALEGALREWGFLRDFGGGSVPPAVGAFLRDKLKLPATDLMALTPDGFIKGIFKRFEQGEWHAVYDLVEYLTFFDEHDYHDAVNAVLEEENAGYRLVDGLITPLTSLEEVAEVEDAVGGVGSSAEHMRNALERFTSRESPDFANAIKEAISAVEAEARLLANEPTAVLSKALTKCGDLHPALRQGIDRLYGYASDDGGIRHAKGEGDAPPSRADARLMLVLCSALVNFLREHRANARSDI